MRWAVARTPTSFWVYLAIDARKWRCRSKTRNRRGIRSRRPTMTSSSWTWRMWARLKRSRSNTMAKSQPRRGSSNSSRFIISTRSTRKLRLLNEGFGFWRAPIFENNNSNKIHTLLRVKIDEILNLNIQTMPFLSLLEKDTSAI